MRSVLVVLAAIAATVVSGGSAAAQSFRKPPSAEKAAALRLDAGPTEARGGTRVYVVQLAAKPGVAYEGGVAGLAKTAPTHGERYNSRTSQVQMYSQHLAAQQDALLAKVGASSGKIYSYRHAMNGFAARMTDAQAAKLGKDKSVLRVWEDQTFYVDTNNSPRFLGLLNAQEGLRAKHGLRGEDVIIGIIDSGIVQEHPSLDDTGYGPPPAGWSGICQAGEGFAATDCNNKLIGARYFIESFGEENTVPEEFISPRDSDGHGTHTATTAGGNENVQATLAGSPVAKISGIAPRARIAVYKACFQAPGAPSAGCNFADSAAATDAAVADGVDLLSFSVGTAFAFDDPQDIAFLFAADAGVIVSRSAGNEGPGPETTAAGEPWVTTVAASTLRGTGFAQATTINSPPALAGDYPSLESSISKSLQETGPITDDLIAANPIEACVALPAGSLAGGIGLIARGTCDFSVKLANAVDAGAVAVLMYTNANPKTVMGGVADEKTLSIPAVMIDNAPGLAILAQLTGGATVNATLAAGSFIQEHLAGNIMAAFSSRGPYPTVPDWIKPDITAPGVQILAGATPEPNDGSFGGLFQYLSGTSMSTPHITGLSALIREAHPDWTPAMVKSALMTTARRNVVKEDGVTKADPHDFGAGHVDANEAIDPGLVYDAGFLDYLAASCGTDTPLVVPDDCDLLSSLGYSLDPSDLNLPSIGIGELPGSQTVHRTVTNVSGKARRFKADIAAPPGFRVEVSPAALKLEPGESATYALTITNRNAPPGEWRFGRITWETYAGHRVRSPIAVKATALIAPEKITGEGTDGSTSFDVTFGYTGDYTAGAHGLAEPFWSAIEVTDDPFNSFDFDFGTDEQLIYLFEAPPGATYLQFNTFDAYNDQPGHDLDLYVFYCPDFLCTQIGQSFNATSNEEVGVQFPLNDPAIDDPYAVFVHGFNTVGGAPASGVFFDWTVEGPVGNMTVSGPASATLGETGTVNVEWAALLSGPGEKQVGAVSHSDATGIQGLTIVNIANDAGGGYCDFFVCTP